jgi:hypothetical protein
MHVSGVLPQAIARDDTRIYQKFPNLEDCARKMDKPERLPRMT